MTGGSRTRGPAARLPPVDRRAASAISACVKLVSCKFCTKNCYFSLFFFFLSLVVLLVFFFFFQFTPDPLGLETEPAGFKARKSVALGCDGVWGPWHRGNLLFHVRFFA